MRLRHALLAALLAAAGPALSVPAAAQAGKPADPVMVGEIAVMQAWARPTTSQARAGGAFVTLHNHGSTDDALVSATSPVAERVELHTHIMEGGVARMREVEGGIAVPAGEMLTLQPGGLHIMLIGLTEQLTPGKRFSLGLSFAKAGSVEVPVTVLAPADQPRTPAAMHGMSHGAGHGPGH